MGAEHPALYGSFITQFILLITRYRKDGHAYERMSQLTDKLQSLSPQFIQKESRRQW